MKDNIILHNFAQLSDEWFGSRLGKVTGSEAWKLFAGKYIADSAQRYMNLLIKEMLSGEDQRFVVTNEAMAHGTATEPYARDRLQEILGMPITEIGLITDPRRVYVGFSPDGYIEEEDALVEIKCPFNVNTHYKRLENIVFDDNNKYLTEATERYLYWQIQFGLWLTGAKKEYFFSYKPDELPGMQEVLLEVFPIPAAFQRIEQRLEVFADKIIKFTNNLEI